jgi:zinc protease
MNQQRTFHFLLACLLSVSLLLPGCAGRKTADKPFAKTAALDCITTGWPQDHSDLKPDPSLVFGTLENGLRYVIMVNHEPKNRVGMYLDVQSGSLQETDEQRGLAHYLEHMVFNGTTHYPPGTLVDYFQSIGMGFGADTNAHTSYDETVYKLLLPGGDEKNLDEGLLVLADYARGALLLEKEVDKERVIILAEKRARDSAQSRVSKAGIKFSFAGTRIAERNPIGTEATLNNADSALLRQYYDTWYRPDNMILVVVGDTDTGLAEKIIRRHFSTIKAGGTAPECFDFGRVGEKGTDTLYVYEPDLGYTGVTVNSVWNVDPAADSLAGQVRHLTEYLGAKILDNRLQHLVNMDGSPMTGANVYAGKMVERVGYVGIDARTRPGEWKQTLKLLNTTLRQALKYGFTDAELERVKKEVTTMLAKQVQMADSRTSTEIVDEIIRALNKNEVYMSPLQEMTLYKPVVEKMTLADVNDAFRGLWHERRLVNVVGTVDLRDVGPSPEAEILQVWKDAENGAIGPWTQENDAAFPYLPIPVQSAAPENHFEYDKIGVDRYLFANGLILNLKQTDFAPNEINVAVVFGNGRLSEPVPGTGMLAERVVGESGLGGLTREQLTAALVSYSSSVRFRVDGDSFLLSGKGLSGESELLFQLLYAYLEDPAFRPGAYRRSMEKLVQMYSQMESSVEGMMQLRGERFLAGGNQRYGFVPLVSLQKITLEQIENWLAPVLKNDGLEVSVVGDFDRDEILQLAGRYFGGQREKTMPVSSGRKISFPSGKRLTLQVHSASDKALLTVAWPTDDFWNISRTRRLSVLASVLDDRLRKQIREELGATYSPVVYNNSSRVDPGYGVLRSLMIVDPSRADMLSEKLKEVGAGLAADGVASEELERALEPVLTSIRDLVRTNRYWLGSVLTGSSRHPQQLEWPLTFQKDFAAITAEDISDLAAQYLQPEKSAAVVIIPEKKK